MHFLSFAVHVLSTMPDIESYVVYVPRDMAEPLDYVFTSRFQCQIIRIAQRPHEPIAEE